LQPAGDDKFLKSVEYQSYNYGKWLKLANCSFEMVKNDVNLDNYDIFTNPPFTVDNTNDVLPALVPHPSKGSVRSSSDQQKNSLAKKCIKLEQNYQKFDEFISSSRKSLGSVHILYPLKLTSQMYHYIAESDMSWNCVDTFTSGGFKLGLWKCEKLLKSEKNMFLDYIISFLDRRKDLHGSEYDTIYQVLLSDLENTEKEYINLLNDRFKEIHYTWKHKRFGEEKETFNITKYNKDVDLNPTLSLKSEVTDLVATNDLNKFSDLATLD
jgi:hypothetical protein